MDNQRNDGEDQQQMDQAASYMKYHEATAAKRLTE
jgi:hypothetical protein